ncbi:MAG: YihY/virulence factor BrkB family protein [Planctomycetota bacterium]|nr:YihY/virulence factor BrkB family protein [Planctomycetota bacterium]
MASDKPTTATDGPKANGNGKPVSFVRLVWASYTQSQLTRMAAALSYRTMFALVPVLVIGLSVLGNFASDQQKTEMIARTLDFAGLSNIAVDQPMDEEGFFSASANDAPATTSPDGNATTKPAPLAVKSPKLAEWIGGIVAKARSIPFATIGFIGLIALIYAGISFMVEIETAFNQIYRAPRGRAWVQRVLQYTGVLILGPLALFTSFYVSQLFTGWVSQLTDAAGFSEVRGLLLGFAAYAATVAISWVALTLTYMSLPNTFVRWAPALAGGLVAAILWEAGKWGFTVYVSRSVSYSQLYGPLALLPLFMLWVYVTWLVVLLGLLLAHALQSYKQVRVLGLGVIGLGGQSDRPPVSPSVVDPGMALPVTVEIAARFARGKPSAPHHLASACGVDEQVIVDLLGQLAHGGLIHRIGNAKDDDAYVLARPAERIDASEVLAVGFQMSDRALGQACPASVASLRQAQLATYRGRSIQSFLPDAARATGGPADSGSGASKEAAAPAPASHPA